LLHIELASAERSTVRSGERDAGPVDALAAVETMVVDESVMMVAEAREIVEFGASSVMVGNDVVYGAIPG
jgi:hypothetical protein